jgi:hypothetical protein
LASWPESGFVSAQSAPSTKPEHPQDAKPAVLRLHDHVVASVGGQDHPLHGQLRSHAFEKAHGGGLQLDDRLRLLGG